MAAGAAIGRTQRSTRDLGSRSPVACGGDPRRRRGCARTGAYFSTAPFVGVTLGIVALGEPVGTAFWAAAALMAGGVWLHVSERHEHTHRHSHDEHHQHEHEFEWDAREPHTHPHLHSPVVHSHPHFPDIHHRHGH